MRRRLLVAALIALMALGSLAVWIGVPVAWLWATRGLESVGTRFVIVIFGCPLTMFATAALLSRLEAAYAHVAGDLQPESGEDDERPRLSLVEVFLVLSALMALLAVVGWWAFLADNPNPSGPIPHI